MSSKSKSKLEKLEKVRRQAKEKSDLAGERPLISGSVEEVKADIKRKDSYINPNNRRYDKKEATQIVNQVYTSLKKYPQILNVFEVTPLELQPQQMGKTSKLKDDEIIQAVEIQIDRTILRNLPIVKDIVAIYKEHGVEVRPRKTIDKNEIILAKKKLIKENLEKVKELAKKN
ncbi:MAG: hypothetical protein ACXWE7_12005 [Nitrososphaeraceae archaeon]